MNVLVTDGENRSALSLTRSLGRSGCSVFVAGMEAHNISGCSKYCKKAFQTPDPLRDGNKFFDKRPELHLNNYKIGHKLKWILGMMDHLIIRLRRGDRLINLPPETPSRPQVARELFKRGDANTSFDVYVEKNVGDVVDIYLK